MTTTSLPLTREVAPSPVSAVAPPTATADQRLTAGQRLRLWVQLTKLRLKEYVAFDSRILRTVGGFALYCWACYLYWIGRQAKAFDWFCKLHRADWFRPGHGRIEALVRSGIQGANPAIGRALDEVVANVQPASNTANVFRNPTIIFNSYVIVLKAATANEKGVVLIKYNHLFPLFAKFFDLERIAKRYYLVLEPAWSGYCDLNLLAYCRFPFPVFVQAYEPRDRAFVNGLNSNLIPVPIGSNWWVDHRLFCPRPEIEKDMDVVMVAGWSSYKRHYRFFEALARLRRQGRRLRTLLVGYSLGWSSDDIVRQAKYYGVADQLEIYERVPYEGVNAHLSRGKVHVLWSRKEGFNRAILESMFAGVPCIIREGFNYNYKYPFINPQTGIYASEADLPRKILWALEHQDEFSPRQWVMANMSCQETTRTLEAIIAKAADDRGEPWRGGLEVKVTRLNCMLHWDPEAKARLQSDYDFLRSCRCES